MGIFRWYVLTLRTTGAWRDSFSLQQLQCKHSVPKQLQFCLVLMANASPFVMFC